MDEILRMVRDMDPEEAMAQMGRALQGLFSVMGEEARVAFVLDLVGESPADKVSSLVQI